MDSLYESSGRRAPEADQEVLRTPGRFHHATVYRQGRVVVKEVGPWGPAVHALLRHLETVGFAGSPRLVGSGFDAQGRMLLSYIEGVFTQPGPWSLAGAAAIGRLLRDLHAATASFQPPIDANWYPWFGRDLGGPSRVIGHCDVAAWNVVARDGLPVALIDWDFAGPVDPLVDLAQACWLNAKLFDDVVAVREGLPPVADRARQLRAMVDAYGLASWQRRGFIDRIIEVVIHATAWEADDAGLGPDAIDHGRLWWALAWRARSAAWLCRNRPILEDALA